MSVHSLLVRCGANKQRLVSRRQFARGALRQRDPFRRLFSLRSSIYGLVNETENEERPRKTNGKRSQEQRNEPHGSSNILILSGPCDRDATALVVVRPSVSIRTVAAGFRQNISESRCADQALRRQKSSSGRHCDHPRCVLHASSCFVCLWTAFRCMMFRFAVYQA